MQRIVLSLLALGIAASIIGIFSLPHAQESANAQGAATAIVTRLITVEVTRVVIATPTSTPTPAGTPTPTPIVYGFEYPDPTAIPNLPQVPSAGNLGPILDVDLLEENALMGDGDDPAIWVHPLEPAKSLIFASAKNGGIAVYDLESQLVEAFTDDEVNNVDILYNFELGGKMVDLLVGSNTGADKLVIYALDPLTPTLENVTDDASPMIFAKTEQDIEDELVVYGLGLYRSPKTGKTYAFVSQESGLPVKQLELTATADGHVAWKEVREILLPEPPEGEEDDYIQSEGIVADSEYGILYIAQEDVGIYKLSAEPDGGSTAKLLDAVKPQGKNLTADVEALTIYYAANGKGYLIASSQGDSTLAVYERDGDNRYLGSFQVRDDEGDGATDSDGADVTNLALGEKFPMGLFVVHDAKNAPQVFTLDEDDFVFENEHTGFELVAWQDIANAFKPPLLIDTKGYDPRKPVNRMK
jgi:myo-inositol-hexaphosphate 3-phosphohydrolase